MAASSTRKWAKADSTAAAALFVTVAHLERTALGSYTPVPTLRRHRSIQRRVPSAVTENRLCAVRLTRAWPVISMFRFGCSYSFKTLHFLIRRTSHQAVTETPHNIGKELGDTV